MANLQKHWDKLKPFFDNFGKDMKQIIEEQQRNKQTIQELRNELLNKDRTISELKKELSCLEAQNAFFQNTFTIIKDQITLLDMSQTATSNQTHAAPPTNQSLTHTVAAAAVAAAPPPTNQSLTHTLADVLQTQSQSTQVANDFQASTFTAEILQDVIH